MGKKIAIITTGSLNDRKGLFNASINRISHLKALADYDIEVFLICYYPTWVMRILTHVQKESHPQEVYFEGIKYNIIWLSMSFVDWISEVKLHKTQYWRRYQLHRLVQNFKDYDLLDVHSSDCGYLALLVKESFGIPFCVTWHGSDIHYSPFASKINFTKTKRILECADYNFFVSKALLETSNKITTNAVKRVLYNGCDEIFVKYSNEVRLQLRKKYDVRSNFIVTFSGSLFPIKNTLILPAIYQIIVKSVPSVEFWFIGDGKVRSDLEKVCKELDLPTRFWGNQPAENMPDFMNLTDVLVLPSKNEGLPLVVAEAINCGSHAVGSRVGGIPEVMGKENTFDLDSSSFKQDFADRIIYFLTEGKDYPQTLSPYFNWKNTAITENEIINEILFCKAVTADLK